MASTVRSQCGEQWQLDLGETRQDPSELLMDDTIYGGGVIVRDEDTPRVEVRMAQEGRRDDGARAIHRGAPEMRWSSRAVVRAADGMGGVETLNLPDASVHEIPGEGGESSS